MSIEAMPKTVTWWGVGVALGAALFIVAAPSALYAWWTPNTLEWQLAFVVLDIVIQIARTLLAPLGAALVAAGLVMRYIDRRLAGDGIADRPRRWRWPDDARERS